MAKKVLILTYYWPPAGGAGVQRCLKFVKYLREFNWEPIVYTVENGEMPVVDHSLLKDVPEGISILKTPIWEPYSIYKKFIGRKKEDTINAAFLSENKKTSLAEKLSVWIRGNFFIPDARKFWIRPSINYLTDFLKKNSIDVVLSSGPPHSMHLIALGLKKQFPDIKWVADFRDPWTNIDFYEDLRLSIFADKKHRHLEKQVLLKADAVNVVGKTWCKEMVEIYKSAGGKKFEKFSAITNGYDEQDIYKGFIEKDQKFSIAHIGSLVKSRNPEVLWRALSELIKTNAAFEKQLEIKLVGKIDYSVIESIEKYNLNHYLKKIDYLPHEEVMKEQQRSKILLLLVNNTKNAKGILTGKFFEYMASNVPIIAIGPEDGDLSEILNDTRCGLISGFNDSETLKKNILHFFSGNFSKPEKTVIEKYSRFELTRKLSELLNKLCGKN